MMGYEGRLVLLDDGDEWVNIPLVVREFMRQLNDEVQVSRTVIESMRQEQKEVGHLLRRVVQKQADLEIDTTRNALSLSQTAQSPHDATEKRHTEQIHYLRKKQEKMEERVRRLTISVSKAPQPVSAAPQEMLDALACRIDSCEAELHRRLKEMEETQHSFQGLVTEAVSTATAEFQIQVVERVVAAETNFKEAEKIAAANQDWIESQKQEMKRVRDQCNELSESLEKDQQHTQGQLSSCFRNVEKLELLCTMQQSSTEGALSRLEGSIGANAAKIHDESKSLYSDIRSLVKSSEHDIEQRCTELAEELRSVKEQQKRLAESLTYESDSTAVRALRNTKELTERVADVEEEMQRHTSTFVARKDLQKTLQETQEALEIARSTESEQAAAVQLQLKQLASSFKTMRTEQVEDSDWLHNEVGRMGTVLSHTTQQRERQERQVTSLCDIVHHLSLAVEALEATNAKTSTTNADKGASTARPSPAGGVAPSASTTDNATAASPAALEPWRSQLMEDVNVKVATVTAHQQRWDRLSQQLNELSAKVDGGAKYAQSMASQQLDHVKQSVKDEVSQQLQSHTALRDVVPALVELETVKRRIAGIELEVQSLSSRVERWNGASVQGAAEETEEATPSSADLLHRLLLLEDGVEDYRDRLLELGQRVLALDQRSNTATCITHRIQEELQDQQRLVAKVGADLTGALEGILHTEESLSRHQSANTSRVTEVQDTLESWKQATVDPLSTAIAAAAPKSAVNAVQAETQQLRADVVRLHSSLDVLAALPLAGVVERVQSVEHQLAQLCSVCTALTDAQAEAASQCARTMKEAVAQERASSQTAQKELEQRHSNAEITQRTTQEAILDLTARLTVTESVLEERAAVTATSSDALAPQPLSEAVALCIQEVQTCQHQLAEHQHRLVTVETAHAAAQKDRSEEWQSRVRALKGEVVACATADIHHQFGDLREELQNTVNAAVLSTSAAAAAEPVGSLSPDLKTVIEPHLTELWEGCQREVAVVQKRVEALEETQGAFEEEMRASGVGKAGSTEVPRQLSHSAEAKEVPQQWTDAVLQSVQTDYYTKTLLEERLESIWASMVTLLARKEDVTAVNEKLDGLHQLMQEEMQIDMERLESLFESQMEDKVTLDNLQAILEEHVTAA